MSIIVPIIEPDAPYREFKLSDIYTPPNGTGRWVPNVDDSIWDWDSGVRYRVTAVNYTSGVSTIVPYIAPASSDSAIDQDLLLGTGPGTQSESYRLYINTSALPFRAAVSERLRIAGSAASFIKLFKGTDISNTGQVVSAMFDQNDQMVSENIPLETVVLPQGNNVAIKVPVEAYVTDTLADGEVVTAVVYSNSGSPLSRSKLLVENTAFVRSANASKKYITGISLLSPFISESDNNLLQYPINVPISSGSLMASVSYSDGSTVILPVDGTKFSLQGMNSYVASVIGQRADLVLVYRLAEDEVSASVNDVNGFRFITENYQVETITADGAFTVKLFTYPVWVDAIVGYRLEHFLYNLDRDQVYYATPYVEFGINSDVWNPLQYGGEQTLVLAVDLDEISQAMPAFRHIQTIGVRLIGPGTLSQDIWRVRYSPGGPEYGASVYAEATQDGANWDINVASGYATQAEWLDELFWKTEPLFNPASELVSPEPTDFALVIGAFRQERPLVQWNQVFQDVNAVISQGVPVYIEWYRQAPGGDLQLAVSALPVRVM